MSGKIWGWGENGDFVLGSVDEDSDDKNRKTTSVTGTGQNNSPNKSKYAKKVTLYRPVELKINKNLVVYLKNKNRGLQGLYKIYMKLISFSLTK